MYSRPFAFDRYFFKIADAFGGKRDKHGMGMYAELVNCSPNTNCIVAIAIADNFDEETSLCTKLSRSKNHRMFHLRIRSTQRLDMYRGHKHETCAHFAIQQAFDRVF